MNMNLPMYPEGTDCVWVALDKNERLGAFVTAGCGPFPAKFLKKKDLAVQEIEEKLLELPVISEARMLISVKRPDDFVALAKRGFFVYDWRDAHRTSLDSTNRYEQVAIPLKAKFLADVPPFLRETIFFLKLEGVSFERERDINVSKHVECLLP